MKIKSFVLKQLEKVNVQVSVLTCALVIFSCLIIFFVTSGIMVSLLADAYNERAHLTFETIESHIDERLYDGTITDGGYGAVSKYLSATQEKMAISSVFVIKKDGDTYKYLLDTENGDTDDGLSEKKIEKEILKETEDLYVVGHADSGFFMYLDGEYRYVNCFPIKQENRTAAVVGISIDAGRVRTIQYLLRILAAVIILLCCVISVQFSRRVFWKISNPLYQDESNTDALTGMKNKNSFSVDMHNIEVGNTERYSIVTIDLNGLKNINDTRGHQTGDLFIQKAGMIIKSALEGTTHIGYRIGGDEFSVIIKDATLDEVKAFAKKLDDECEKTNQKAGLRVSMSIGYAKFDKEKDRNFSMTMERSDAMMYENKRLYYKKKNMTPR